MSRLIDYDEVVSKNISRRLFPFIVTQKHSSNSLRPKKEVNAQAILN